MDIDPPSPSSFPTPLISPLCSIIYSLSIPLAPETSTLDPRPPPSSEIVARELLLNLALVNKEFYHTARPWLWRSLIIARPRGWIGIVEKIGGEQAKKDWAAELARGRSARVGMRRTVSSSSASPGGGNGSISPTESGSGSYISTPRRSRSISQRRQLQHVEDDQEMVEEGFGALGLVGGGGGGGGGRRSQSIERSTVFVESQMSALKRSTSLGSQGTPSTVDKQLEEDREERRDELSIGEMLLTPPGSREASPSRYMGAGGGEGSGSWRGRSSERVGRSRVRLMGVGMMRESSIHSILEGVREFHSSSFLSSSPSPNFNPSQIFKLTKVFPRLSFIRTQLSPPLLTLQACPPWRSVSPPPSLPLQPVPQPSPTTSNSRLPPLRRVTMETRRKRSLMRRISMRI